MKTWLRCPSLVMAVGTLWLMFIMGFVITGSQEPRYILDHENDIAVENPGPHNGGGITTAYPFFKNFKEGKITFRKRVLHPGSSIGYHLQEQQEIYYVIKGRGVLKMNGKDINVVQAMRY